MAHDSSTCGMCGQLRRTINRGGYVWRLCSTCDAGKAVPQNDDGGTAPPGQIASV